MSLQGKRDDFTLADFEACGKAVSLRRGRARALVEEVRAAVTRWPEFAEAAGVPEASTKRVAGAHRTLPKHSARA
jgi:serine/threonine-protein kinase HipA